MFSQTPRVCALLLWITLPAADPVGDDWPNPADRWPTIGPPAGTLLIHGGYHGGEGADAFLALIDDPTALVVVIPTAGSDADCGPDAPATSPLIERGAENVVVLHTRERSIADSAEFVAPLQKAAGVWISGGQQSRLARAYLHTRTHTELFRVLERGGVIAGNSAGASIQGSFLYGGRAAGDVGFGFVRNSAIGQHYIRRKREGGLQRIVGADRQLLGIGIDEGTFVVVRGDTFTVAGRSKVAVCDPRRAGWPGDQPYEYLYAGDAFDMQARRALRATTWEPADRWEHADTPWQDPAAEWKTLGPPAGLLLVTGDRPALETAQRFVELAGGAEARIVVIPAFNGRESDPRSGEAALLEEAGARDIRLWHTADRRAANSKRFVAPLTRADAVWIGSGEQWMLADAYLHTLAHRELSRVLQRGGVIAGSGGGGRFLASSMAGDAAGWNEGLGFLRATALHTWRAGDRKTSELVEILKEHQSLLGVGIDDRTAILVRADEFAVSGSNRVAVMDATRRGWPWTSPDEPYVLLEPGDRYDMQTRRPDW